MKGYVNLTHTNNGKINELGDKIDNLTKNAQSDWEQTDESALDYIKNKPIIPEGSVLYPTTGQHTDGAMTQKAVTTELNRLSDNVSQLSNPNLLINGDFSINQRGQEEYGNATQYTVDRWQLSTQTNANISFNATTKTLSNTGTTAGYFVQRIEPSDVAKIWGKTWTFSVKVNGNVYSVTFTAPDTAPTSSQDIAPTLVCVPNICQVRLYYYANSGTIGFTFNIFTGSVTLGYAKLEVGSVATPFSPRPYAEELALCQRYYQVLGIDSVAYSTYGAVSYENEEYYAANTSIPLISTMRTTPTVKIITMPYIRNYNNLNSIAFRMNQIILFRNNEIQLQFLADGVEMGAIYVSNGGLVSLDAELY